MSWYCWTVRPVLYACTCARVSDRDLILLSEKYHLQTILIFLFLTDNNTSIHTTVHTVPIDVMSILFPFLQRHSDEIHMCVSVLKWFHSMRFYNWRHRRPQSGALLLLEKKNQRKTKNLYATRNKTATDTSLLYRKKGFNADGKEEETHNKTNELSITVHSIRICIYTHTPYQYTCVMLSIWYGFVLILIFFVEQMKRFNCAIGLY